MEITVALTPSERVRVDDAFARSVKLGSAEHAVATWLVPASTPGIEFNPDAKHSSIDHVEEEKRHARAACTVIRAYKAWRIRVQLAKNTKARLQAYTDAYWRFFKITPATMLGTTLVLIQIPLDPSMVGPWGFFVFFGFYVTWVTHIIVVPWTRLVLHHDLTGKALTLHRLVNFAFIWAGAGFILWLGPPISTHHMSYVFCVAFLCLGLFTHPICVALQIKGKAAAGVCAGCDCHEKPRDLLWLLVWFVLQIWALYALYIFVQAFSFFWESVPAEPTAQTLAILVYGWICNILGCLLQFAGKQLDKNLKHKRRAMSLEFFGLFISVMFLEIFYLNLLSSVASPATVASAFVQDTFILIFKAIVEMNPCMARLLQFDSRHALHELKTHTPHSLAECKHSLAECKHVISEIAHEITHTVSLDDDPTDAEIWSGDRRETAAGKDSVLVDMTGSSESKTTLETAEGNGGMAMRRHISSASTGTLQTAGESGTPHIANKVSSASVGTGSAAAGSVGEAERRVSFASSESKDIVAVSSLASDDRHGSKSSKVSSTGSLTQRKLHGVLRSWRQKQSVAMWSGLAAELLACTSFLIITPIIRYASFNYDVFDSSSVSKVPEHVFWNAMLYAFALLVCTLGKLIIFEKVVFRTYHISIRREVGEALFGNPTGFVSDGLQIQLMASFGAHVLHDFYFCHFKKEMLA